MAIESFTQPSRFDELIIGTQIPCTPGASQVYIVIHCGFGWVCVASFPGSILKKGNLYIGKVVDFHHPALTVKKITFTLKNCLYSYYMCISHDSLLAR